MELLNNIWTALTTPNGFLINIMPIPGIIIESLLSLLIFTTLFQIEATNKQKFLYVFSSCFISFITVKIIPSPINSIFNYICIFTIIYIIFKKSFLKSLLASLSPTVFFALIGSLLTNPFLTLFNISPDDLMFTPIYRIIYLFLIYSCVFIIILLLKLKQCTLKLPNFNIDKKSKKIIFVNLFVTFITLCIQLIINFYYTHALPIIITFLNFISLVVYFSINLYSLTRVIKLAYTTQQLENAEEYNKTLNILHDNVRAFKHDFDNIVTTIGGYVKTNDMDGLKKYYYQLEDDCQKVNNLYILNPEIINDPGIYSLLTTKYHEAYENDIKINMSVLLDLRKLNIKIYEFTRILGILLDNAIEACKDCDEKTINIIFRDDATNRRQLVTVENTYNDKNLDTEKIFQKGFSGKENHTGLGLWEVRKILNKSKNLSLYTTKGDKYFSQQIEIYYN